MTEIAENRGVQIVETRPTRNAITLSLTVDGNFSFERELMGARTVSSGTYKVQDGDCLHVLFNV